MKKSIIIPAFTIFVLSFVSCGDAPKQEAAVETKTTEATAPVPPAIVPVQVKAEIVAIETAWAAALNSKDINALMAIYADDAVSMPDGEPIVSGKAAIRVHQEKEFAGKPSFASIAFETLDVYAQGDVATEVGITKYLDAAGKEMGRGKYFAVFEKRDGKYLCIREIYNKDSK